LGFFFPQLFDIKNLVKTSKMLANLVEFTQAKHIFSKTNSQIYLKDEKNCPKKIQ